MNKKLGYFFLALTLFGILKAIFFPGLFQLPSIYLYFLLLFLFPGWIGSSFFLPFERYDLPARLAVSMAIGFALITVPCLLAYLFRINVEHLFYLVLLCISLPAALLAAWRDNPPARAAAGESSEKSRLQEIALSVFFTLAVAVALRDFFYCQRLQYTNDVYHDLAEIVKYVYSPASYGWSPHIKDIYTTAVHLYHIPILILALLVYSSGGLDTYLVYSYISPLITLVNFCGVYFLVSTLFKNKPVALFVVLISLWPVTELGSLTSYTTEIIYIVALTFVLRTIVGGSRPEFILAVILGGFLFQWRVTKSSYFLMAVTLLGLSVLVFDRRNRSALKAISKIVILSLLISVPFIIIKVSHPAWSAFRVSAEYYPFRLIKIPWNMFYINPLDYVYHNYDRVIALILCPWLLVYRKYPWALFMFALMVFPVYVQFFPPFATLAAQVLDYLFVWKLAGLVFVSQFVLNLALFLVLVQLSGSLQFESLEHFRFKALLPLALATAALALLLLASRSLVDFIIARPDLRAAMREWFNSSGFSALWEHKHLLLVVLPVLIWVSIAIILELKKNTFSRMESRDFFQSVFTGPGRIPMIIALVFSAGSFIFSTYQGASVIERDPDKKFGSVEERLGPLPGIEYIKKLDLEQTTILSQPEASFIVPAYTYHYVYTVYARRFGSLIKRGVVNFDERLDFVGRLLDPGKPVTGEQYAAIQRDGITLIYLVRELAAPGQIEKIETATEYFTKVFESPLDVVFTVNN